MNTIQKFWFLRIYQWLCIPPFIYMLGNMIWGMMIKQSDWLVIGTSLSLFIGIWLTSQMLMARWENEFKEYDKLQSNIEVQT